MCEPIDDEFDSAEDQEDYDEDREDESYEVATDADEWRRGKSRQYGGGEVVGRAVEDQPPPLSFVNQEPAGTKDDALHSAAVSWEYRRDEDTGMSVRTPLCLCFTFNDHYRHLKESVACWAVGSWCYSTRSILRPEKRSLPPVKKTEF